MAEKRSKGLLEGIANATLLITIAVAGLGGLALIAILISQGYEASQRALLKIGEGRGEVAAEQIVETCGKILLCEEYRLKTQKCSLGSNIDLCVSLHMDRAQYEKAGRLCQYDGTVMGGLGERWLTPPTVKECYLFQAWYSGR